MLLMSAMTQNNKVTLSQTLSFKMLKSSVKQRGTAMFGDSSSQQATAFTLDIIILSIVNFFQILIRAALKLQLPICD